MKNAKIKSTQLGLEDHGIMTCTLVLEYGEGGCQCFGGHDLRYEKYGIDYVTKILETVGVQNWEDLTGKYIRVNGGGFNDTIKGIGHITEDKWFNPQKDLDK